MFLSIQMQRRTPSPQIGLAFIAGVLRKESVSYAVIEAVGDGADTISSYAARLEMKAQG